MGKKSSSGTIFLVIMLAIVFVLGIGKPAPAATLEQKLYEAAKKEGAIEYWDTLSMKEIMELWKGFESKYPGIKLNYFEVSSISREEKYLAEHAAGRHTADIVPIDLYRLFKEKGLLTDLSDIVNDTRYPKKFCSQDLHVAAVEHTLTGVAYNAKLVSPKDAPRTWDDLLHPKWKGKIGVESRMKYFIFGTGYWGETWVMDYLKKLGKQEPSFVSGATVIMTLLGAGEYAIAVGPYFHRTLDFQAKGIPVEWSQLGPIVDNLNPHAVMRHAPHPNAAKLFLHWWMSPEGSAYVDSKRHKGNPEPGSGTQTSKILEQRGKQEIYVWFPWGDVDQMALEKKYHQAVGYAKEKEKKK